MNRKRSFWRIAASLTMGALFASHGWADSLYVGAQGMKQGVFRGLPTGPGRGMVQVMKFAFDEHAGIDPASGQVNGRRQYSAVRLTKLLDPSSAQYLQAAASNETLSNVTINFFAPKASGELVLVRSVVLTNAQVIAVEHYTEPDANGSPVVMEQISLNFQKYSWTENADGGLTMMDSIGPTT